MGSHRTSDEVLRDYQKKMGVELGDEFNRLYNECAWLHLKWRDYRALFGTSSDRIDLLNAAAGGFFVMIETTMREDLLLHICRLTDQPSNKGRGRRERLSVLRLTTQVDPKIHDKVRGLVSKAIKETEFARDWRDRYIAHRDLPLALKLGARPLAKASRKKMSEAIDGIVAVLHAVEGHYLGTTVAYEHVSHLGDAETLLHILRDGVETRNDEMRTLRAGQLPAGFFKSRRPT